MNKLFPQLEWLLVTLVQVEIRYRGRHRAIQEALSAGFYYVKLFVLDS